MQDIVVLVLVWLALLLAQWFLYAWWLRSVGVGLLAVYLAAVLASPGDVARPFGDAAAHVLQPRGQATVARALGIAIVVAVAMLVAGFATTVRRRWEVTDVGVSVPRVKPWFRYELGPFRVPFTDVEVYWARQSMWRDDDRLPVWLTCFGYAVAFALAAVALYYALVAALRLAYERRGLSASRAETLTTSHVGVLFWVLVLTAILVAVWWVRQWAIAVHIVIWSVGTHQRYVSSWRHGFGRVLGDHYKGRLQASDPRAQAPASPTVAAPVVPAQIGGAARADLDPRRGWTCEALLIFPPAAGWPPDPRGATYAAECAAWYNRLVGCIGAAEFGLLPAEGDMDTAPKAPTETELRMRKALRSDGVRIEHGRGVAKDGTPAGSRRQGSYYWPDAAIRIESDLLLIDVETDGPDHARPGREERDKQRNAFFNARG